MVSKVASSRRVLVFLTQAGVQSWHSNIEVRILRRCVVAPFVNECVTCILLHAGESLRQVPAVCCEHLDLFVMSIWIFLSRAHCLIFGYG